MNGATWTPRPTRTRVMTEKGRENALERKGREIRIQMYKLSHFIQNSSSSGEIPRDGDIQSIEQTGMLLGGLISEFREIIEQTEEPTQSDVELIDMVDELLHKTSSIVSQIKNNKTDKSSAITRHTGKSKNTRAGSSVSSASSSSSAKLRAKALAETAAARKRAEFERRIAEEQYHQKQREAEQERQKSSDRALHEKNIATLTADRDSAVAAAKLEAINQIISEETGVMNGEDFEGGEDQLDDQEREKRTEEWVNKSIDERQERNEQREEYPDNHQHKTPTTAEIAGHRPRVDKSFFGQFQQQASHSRPAFESTPIRDVTGTMIEALTTTNQRIVSGIAKQNLPKCHPDTFNGDVTLFHPWKKAFKATLSDIDVTPEQEINYLRKFTSAEAQRVVDNYRKRQSSNPIKLLGNLWSELERRFGSPAVITNVLLERLRDAAKFDENDKRKLQEFSDICADVDSQIESLPGLACLNYPIAITPIVQKMPPSLKAKWDKEVARFAEQNNDEYPKFHNLARIVERQSIMKNHPNITSSPLERPTFRRNPEPHRKALATKFVSPVTQPNTYYKNKESKSCPLHNSDGHAFADCKAFASKSLKEKTEFVKKAGLCFLCFSNEHNAKNCSANVSCKICGDKRHNALLHKEKPEAPADDTADQTSINNKCTSTCDSNGGPSCGKIVLVDVYRQSRPGESKRVYAIIDDQSNASLVTSELLDVMGVDSPREKYFLSTCSSSNEVRYGRKVSGITVRSVMEKKEFSLPRLTECDAVPSDKQEIPTPEMVGKFPHLKSIADEIPPLDPDANIHILLGRDAPELLKVRAFRNGPRGAPWAQKLSLGWTVSGQVCLDRANHNVHVKARKTKVDEIADENTRAEGPLPHSEECDVRPCPNQFTLRSEIPKSVERALLGDVFYTRQDDNEPSLSIEDRKFISIMEKGLTKNELGNWEMPLPFRQESTVMPFNRPQAAQRLNSLIKTLKRKPEMRQHYVEFMEKIIARGHATQIRTEDVKLPESQVWYLPHFGVYHPKKPHQIRVVFDSSAEYDGVSLNSVLLPGPDLANNLTGVLFRFRKEGVAVMCDIEQMFHSFHVSAKHRNYLRFLWFKDNDPEKEICEYRMNVHLFGNGPSPAVATYGLRATVDSQEVVEEVKEFVNRNFYVDDGLLSAPTAREAIHIVKESQQALATANLRLHKVVSNSREVMQAFPITDRAKDLLDLDLSTDGLPAQRSLGVYWNLENDSFTFRISDADKPFTRRGVLSTINSVYDPLGIAAPIVIDGKRLLQQLMLAKKTDANALGWDDPLPERQMSQWQRWKSDLRALEDVTIPRCYKPEGFGRVRRTELHVFSDASQDALAAAVYLRLFDDQGNISVALVYGQAKVAPIRPTSIPRLELCAAVMATQAVSKVKKELDMQIDEVTYYTDSQVVLGYILNEKKRFYVYVANRVQIIRSLTSPDQWRHIEGERNPADIGTRGISAKKLQTSLWVAGPDFLKDGEELARPSKITDIDADPEVRNEITTMKTVSNNKTPLGAKRFERFSSFTALRQGIATLISWVKKFKARQNPTMSNNLRPALEELNAATNVIMKEVQLDAGLTINNDTQQVNKAQKIDIDGLNPFIDANGVMRVGGRLRRSLLTTQEKHPAIIPKDQHLTTLIVEHFHKKVHHQGRQITHAAVRQGGYWVIGGHRLVSKVLHNCIVCRKARGTRLCQRMADLPSDRLEEVPPFTNVGIDVFGPWTIVTRKTRGGAANSKRWGLLFSCLNSRAIHIEVLESMDASSFICALRRFFSLRGPATILRCDRGTNFIGGQSELQPSDEKRIEEFVTQQGCEWKFNPPHASHFGGVWERQIGTVRRVLDAMFAELGYQQLTHELLTTLMSEVTGIVNARPLAAIPTDSDDPQPLSPQTILTMKTRPLGPPCTDILPADLYARRRWRRVQYLAEQFWVRWRREYLQSLQVRSKWTKPKRNLKDGDIVLIKDQSEHRNNWPMGRVSEAIKSEDGLVRKAQIVTCKGGKAKTTYRPIKELVLLLPVEEQD